MWFLVEDVLSRRAAVSAGLLAIGSWHVNGMVDLMRLVV